MDWRLPNARELHSLIDYGNSGPALPAGHPFSGVVASFYWSSTTYLNPTTFVWVEDFNNGGITNSTKVNAQHVWPVRGGQ